MNYFALMCMFQPTTNLNSDRYPTRFRPMVKRDGNMAAGASWAGSLVNRRGL